MLEWALNDLAPLPPPPSNVLSCFFPTYIYVKNKIKYRLK